MKSKVTITLTDKILRNVDSIVDNIFLRNRSQAIEYLIESTLGKNKTAVILATGPSESLRLNKDEFRVTAKIDKSYLIELTISNLRELGFKKIFIIGEKPVLNSVFAIVGEGSRYGLDINYIEDSDPPGTGESLRLVKGELKSTFLVLFGDILTNKNDIKKLWEQHFRNKGIATIMISQASQIRGGSLVPVKKSLIQIDGDKVIKTYTKEDSKKLRKEILLAMSSTFVAEPEIFSYTGYWIESDILPVLAEKNLLYNYVSSQGEFHIHSTEDKKLARIELLKSNF